ASVTLSNSTTSATSTLTLTTVASHAKSGKTTAEQRRPGLGWWMSAGGALVAGVFLVGVPSRRRWMPLLGLLVCVMLAGGVACGGGGSSPGGPSTGSGTGTGSTSNATATPTFSPAAGAVSSGTAVTISDSTANSKIYCTTDGSMPSVSTSSQ